MSDRIDFRRHCEPVNARIGAPTLKDHGTTRRGPCVTLPDTSPTRIDGTSSNRPRRIEREHACGGEPVLARCTIRGAVVSCRRAARRQVPTGSSVPEVADHNDHGASRTPLAHRGPRSTWSWGKWSVWPRARPTERGDQLHGRSGRRSIRSLTRASPAVAVLDGGRGQRRGRLPASCLGGALGTKSHLADTSTTNQSESARSSTNRLTNGLPCRAHVPVEMATCRRLVSPQLAKVNRSPALHHDSRKLRTAPDGPGTRAAAPDNGRRIPWHRTRRGPLGGEMARTSSTVHKGKGLLENEWGSV